MTDIGTVVVGVGSPLMGDDGLGLAALERLEAEWEFRPFVECVDGATWGMNLLPFIERSGRLLILDAIDAGREPGELIALEREEIPLFFSAKLSPHQIELSEVLALADLRGTLPEETIAIGLQPGRVEMSYSLSPEVESRLADLVQLCVDRLRTWGHRAVPKTGSARSPKGSLRSTSSPDRP